MRYTDEQYNQKVQTLSSRAQAYLESDDLSNALLDTYFELSIPREKQAIVTEEVLYVLAGIQPKANLVGNIKQFAGLDEATSQNVVTALETTVFIPFEDLNLPATLDDAPEREVTLRKITTSNPVLNEQLKVPVIHHEPLQAPKRVQPASQPVATPKPAEAPVQKPTEPSILGARLGGSFNMPKEEVNVSSPTTPAPKKVDPYREPIE
jgi:hypothetical protein